LATEQGQTVVNFIDIDEKTVITYMVSQNMAIKGDFAQAPQAATKNIEEHKPVVIGTETLDGKLCTVVEYSEAGIQVKTWIWKEKGLPLRIEQSGTRGKVIVELKNIDFSDIPDSMFQLPAGVQILDMPAIPPIPR